MRLALAEDPTTLDPVQIVDVSGAEVAAKVYAGLVRFTPDGDVVPDLAASWTVTENGRVYRFHLRDGLTFHSGRPLTATSVVASLERLATPASGSRRSWLLDRVDGVAAFRQGHAPHVRGLTAEDAHTIRITLTEPFGIFPSLLAMPNAAIVDPVVAAKGPRAFATEPAGAGPYRLAQWQRGRVLELDAFGRYHAGPPRNSEVIYHIIPEPFSRVALFERGELDILDVPATEVARFQADARWAPLLHRVTGLNTYYLGINCARGPGRDRTYRQALNLAINNEQIVRVLLRGLATPARGPIPPSLRGGGASDAAWEYDPARARQLLGRITLPSRPLRLYVRATQEAISIAEALQAYLSEAGLEVELVQREWSALKAAIVEGEADLFFLSWYADYPHAENFLAPVFHSANWGAGGNRAQYASASVDAQIRALQGTVDAGAQRQLIAAIAGTVVEDAPWVFLWHQDRLYVRQPWITNFTPSAIPNGDPMLAIESQLVQRGGVAAPSRSRIGPLVLLALAGITVVLIASPARQYAGRRLLIAVPTLLGVTLITFALLRSMPGDPVYALVGQQADEATIAQLREALQLDAPLPAQYVSYVGLLARGELGRSYYTGIPVAEALMEKLPNTLRLAVAAMVVSVLVGSTLGLGAAVLRGRWGDVLCSSGALVGLSVPTFWLGLVLVYVFAYRLGALPVAGMGRGELAYLVLPAITLGTQSAAFVARVTRTALLEVFSQPFLTAVRAKGVHEWRVVLVHAYRNALLPLVTLFGVDLGSYLNGAVLTETIFGWDGIGRYAMTGVLQHDFPVVLGTVLFGAVIFVVVNLIVDVSYAVLDPRVRLQRGAVT